MGTGQEQRRGGVSGPDSDLLLWPTERLEEAVDALLRKAGQSRGHGAVQESQSNGNAPPAARIEQQAMRLGCEAVALESTFAELTGELGRACPFVIQVEPGKFVAAWETAGQDLRVLTAGGDAKTVSINWICGKIRSPVEQTKRGEYQQLFAQAGLGKSEADRATRALLEEQFGGYRLQNAWILRRPVSNTSIPEFLRQAGVLRNSVYLIGAHLVE